MFYKTMPRLRRKVNLAKAIVCMKKTKKLSFIIFAVIFICASAAYTLWADTALQLNRFTVTSSLLPPEFDGMSIAVVSDLHNAVFGDDNEELINMLKEADPDIIAITGDIVDSRRTDVDAAVSFAVQAAGTAPCYYVTGNHEARIPQEQYNRLEKGLTDAGVIVLHNEQITVEKDGARLLIAGMDDPDYFSPTGALPGTASQPDDTVLNNLIEPGSYNILLAHKPEYFNNYCTAGAQLVLSGHAHGGQFRLPFIGGLVAPGQGLFPEYDSGLYEQGGTVMAVSRGLGNSIIPLRVNNRPEIMLITLG